MDPIEDDEKPEAVEEIVEAVAETAAEIVEEANERAEVAEAVAEAVIEASVEDRREARIADLERGMDECRNLLNSLGTTNSEQMAEIREMIRMQAEAITALSNPTPSNPVQVEAQDAPAPEDPVEDPAKMEALQEAAEIADEPQKSEPPRRKRRVLL